jgi:hypothetical protein
MVAFSPSECNCGGGISYLPPEEPQYLISLQNLYPVLARLANFKNLTRIDGQSQLEAESPNFVAS